MNFKNETPSFLQYMFCVLASFILLLPASCRKDSSSYTVSPVTSAGNCLIQTSSSEDGSYQSIAKYSLDSIMTESVTKLNGIILDAWYLKEENPRQFIFLSGSNNPADAISRIYLNPDGTIAKEVMVILNNDGSTFTEVDDEANIFTYNEKKQLVSVIRHFGDDKGVFTFRYDSKNRIENISIFTDDGLEVARYGNITYQTQAKNDNLLNIQLFESMSSYFIPSLRNVYIKSYTLAFPDAPFLDVDTEFSYRFENGKLSGVKTTVTAFGTPVTTDLSLTLSCK